MKKIIPVAGPSITKKEINYVKNAIKNGWYENAFDYIKKFEDKFKKYVNRKYAISLPSCTSALHLSLLSLNIKLPRGSLHSEMRQNTPRKSPILSPSVNASSRRLGSVRVTPCRKASGCLS